jgi:hypothetical protein
MSNPKYHLKQRQRRFRGHSNYRNAHQRILLHPLKSEASFFQIHGFSIDQVFWPLETSSVRGTSISAITDLLRSLENKCPSGEAVLKCLRDIPETEVEAVCNRLLLAQFKCLPAAVRRELEQSGTIISDKHSDPYWGDSGKVAVIKGQNNHDSYFHFIYFTMDLISEHYRFTIYAVPYVEGFPLISYIKPVLQAIKSICPVKRVLFDGEFSNLEDLSFLDQEGIAWDARKSFTPRVKKELSQYKIDPMQFLHPRWHVVEIKGGPNQDTVAVHITAYKLHSLTKVITKPIWDNLSVKDAIALYEWRFAIDNGYKEKHSFQAVTSSRNWAVRLLLFVISVMLWNVWRLALAWDFINGMAWNWDKTPIILTRNVIMHELSEYLVYIWWRL